MVTDRNLLFGVLALQADLLDPTRFAEACTAWSARKDTPLGDLLVERGWLTPEERADVAKLLERKLKKHGGDANAGLAEITTDPVRQSLAALADPDIRQSLAGLTTPPQGLLLVSTTAYEPDARDRYTLSRLHATGGIGRVWLARDSSLGRDVALKELRPERAGSPAAWARFLKEAQVTGQLEHPGIVPIYELGRRPEDHQPFYTMRFVRGRTLAEAIASYHHRRRRGEAGPLELRELLTGFMGVCNAVAYAHSRGVLHRDLKPQNVVLGDYGEVIVLDWGLAKLMDRPDDQTAPLELPAEGQADGTVQGQVLGTPAYMAPEQAEGRLDLLGPASDVYGLGTILYEILTSRPPFKGHDPTAVLRQVVHEAPARVRSLEKGAPAALEAVCLKALAKRAGERYGTAKELAAEVQRWLAGEPVLAYPEPWTLRARRWVGRHRTLVTAVAATVSVATVCLALATVLLSAAYERERRSRAKAEENFHLAREAVDKYYTKVSNSPKLKAHGLESLRKELLLQAKEYYEKFVEGQGAEPDVQLERGRVYARLADITSETGSASDAIQLYLQALDIFQLLAREYEDNRDLRSEQAQAHSRLGLSYQQTGQPALAKDALDQALTLAEELTREAPEVAEYRNQLARVTYNEGRLAQVTGQPEQAAAMFRRAQECFERLVREYPDGADYHDLLGKTLGNLALLYAASGKSAEAKVAYKDALSLFAQLIAKHPEVPEYQNLLAMTYHNIGFLHRNLGELGDAQAYYEKALPIKEHLAQEHPAVLFYQEQHARLAGDLALLYQDRGLLDQAKAAYEKPLQIFAKLSSEHPSVPAYQHGLARTYGNFGLLYGSLGQAAQSVLAFEKAVSLFTRLAQLHPEVPEFGAEMLSARVDLAKSRARLGEYIQAASDAKELGGKEGLSGAVLYDVARVYCLAVGAVLQDTKLASAQREKLAAEYALGAVEMLGRSRTAGFLKERGKIEELKNDKDFACLRPRKDFQKLLGKPNTEKRDRGGVK
jgi:serine/threonine-protein kinase